MLIFFLAFQDLLRALPTPCVPLPGHGCSRHPTCVPKHSSDPWYDHHCGTRAILSQEEADTLFGRQSLGFERPLGNRCSTRGRYTHNTQRGRDHRVWSTDWVMPKELARYRRAYECLKNNSERVLFEKCFSLVWSVNQCPKSLQEIGGLEYIITEKGCQKQWILMEIWLQNPIPQIQRQWKVFEKCSGVRWIEWKFWQCSQKAPMKRQCESSLLIFKRRPTR